MQFFSRVTLLPRCGFNTKLLVILSNYNKDSGAIEHKFPQAYTAKEKQMLALLCDKFRALNTQNQGNFNKEKFIFSGLHR